MCMFAYCNKIVNRYIDNWSFLWFFGCVVFFKGSIISISIALYSLTHKQASTSQQQCSCWTEQLSKLLYAITSNTAAATLQPAPHHHEGTKPRPTVHSDTSPVSYPGPSPSSGEIALGAKPTYCVVPLIRYYPVKIFLQNSCSPFIFIS